MFTYKRFRTSKSAVTILLIALALVALGMLGLTGNTLARRKPATAEVTITGPIETEGETQTFGLGKDSSQALVISRGSWTDLGPVPIKYDFANTVADCYCKEGGDLEQCDLTGHLIDSVPGEELLDFPYRWGVRVEIDMSSLGEFELGKSSTTNYKGGHSIDIWTDPFDDPTATPTVTGTRERLWIPQGPSKSGPVTVEWVSDTGSNSSPRERVFKFTQNPDPFPALQLQVVSYRKGNVKKEQERKIMRCYIHDLPITVKVVTTP